MQLAGGGGTPVRGRAKWNRRVCVSQTTDGLTDDEAVVQAAEDVAQDDHLAQVEVDG